MKLVEWCELNNNNVLFKEYSKTNIGDFCLLTHGSHKKVFWECSNCNNMWSAEISKRTLAKEGCPYCANKIVRVGLNDLKTLYPELIKDWNYAKNKLGPDNYFAFSNKKVFWKCRICENEWECVIQNRTRKNSGCPECKKGFQSSYPEQFLYLYFKQLGMTVVNRKKINKIEIDIYFPEINVGIEYNGVYYHNDSSKANVKKEKLRNENIFLFVINEVYENKDIEEVEDNVFVIPRHPKDKDILKLSKKLTSKLNEMYNLKLSLNNTFDINSFVLDAKSHVNITKKENTLAYVFPDLVTEWDIKKWKSYSL